MSTVASMPIRCRYCKEDADIVVEGWRFVPDLETEGTQRAALRVPVCLIHASTGRLRLVSEGFTPELQTEFDLGAWCEGVIGERRKRRRR